MKVKIQIPAQLIQPTLNEVSDLIGVENIGWVGLAGDWNNWGDSPEKAGCVRPNTENEMQLEGENYVLEVDLTVGLHRFKPVIITNGGDQNEMCGASWIACPSNGVPPYTRESGDSHSNWQIIVKP